jgi:hypothetical protein
MAAATITATAFYNIEEVNGRGVTAERRGLGERKTSQRVSHAIMFANFGSRPVKRKACARAGSSPIRMPPNGWMPPLAFKVAFAMLPGPLIGGWLGTHFGIPSVSNGQAGFIPTPLIFQVAGLATLLAARPLAWMKERKS